MSACFHMKDLWVLKYFLGVEVTRSLDGFFLCQRKYALDIISGVGLLGAKLAHVPMEQNHCFALFTSILLADSEPYHRLIGDWFICVLHDLNCPTMFMFCPNSCNNQGRIISKQHQGRIISKQHCELFVIWNRIQGMPSY